MSPSDLIQVLLGILVAGGGYWLSRLANDVRDIEDRINECQSRLPEKYVLKEDYKHDIADIKQTLKDIFEILREDHNR
jgi:hypothetical protein